VYQCNNYFSALWKDVAFYKEKINSHQKKFYEINCRAGIIKYYGLVHTLANYRSLTLRTRNVLLYRPQGQFYQWFSQRVLKGRYHCTVNLLFDWYGLVCFANKNKNFQLLYSWFQTSQTGGQCYSDTSPFSIPWIGRLNLALWNRAWTQPRQKFLV
jgi:hypothetical protein